MSDDIFEPLILFRPQIAGRSRQGDPNRMPSLRSSIASGMRALAKVSGGRVGTTPRARYDVGELRAKSRRCVVKSHYVSTAGGGRVAAGLHLAYLERDGVERDGSPGRLYGPDETFDREAFAEPQTGERRQFRFIVSPEDAGEIDLRIFTRDLMAQMEKDLDRRLLWAAVNHHNTDHPHVHIVVRGVDAEGEEFRIPPRYIKNDMRIQAQQLLTRELGPRAELEIARQRSQEIGQERLTSIDRRMAPLVSAEGHLSPRDLAKLPRDEQSTLLARLVTLARLGVARKLPHGAWELAPGWEQNLTNLGLRNDVIKRLHQLVPGDVSRYRFIEPSQLTAPIEGVVRGKGLHDELTGELFAAVETPSGETHYVRLEPLAAEGLQAGDVVRVARTVEPWVKSTDHVLARVAALNGGIYDPSAHLQQLSGLGQKAASPADLVAGNIRRLERLERYGLVTRLPGGSWEIPADLEKQLLARESSHPRHRLRVQYAGASVQTQVRYPGPTWLDRQPQSAPERASVGFGAELTTALRDRDAFLRARGLGMGAPDQAKRLDQMERLLLGRRLATDLGLLHVDVVSGLRGTLTACPPLPSGRAFARVVDDRTKRLVLVPATPETNRLEGRSVEVTVDQNQGVVLRPARRLTRGDESP
jgi:type IV secretory pathway VirD2 relaxase